MQKKNQLTKKENRKTGCMVSLTPKALPITGHMLGNYWHDHFDRQTWFSPMLVFRVKSGFHQIKVIVAVFNT